MGDVPSNKEQPPLYPRSTSPQETRGCTPNVPRMSPDNHTSLVAVGGVPWEMRRFSVNITRAQDKKKKNYATLFPRQTENKPVAWGSCTNLQKTMLLGCCSRGDVIPCLGLCLGPCLCLGNRSVESDFCFLGIS